MIINRLPEKTRREAVRIQYICFSLLDIKKAVLYNVNYTGVLLFGNVPNGAKDAPKKGMKDLNTDLLETIRERIPQFSKGQKRIAEYIINHYDKAAYMTAVKLGEEVGVSESTVVRFADELGFDGYPALRQMIQNTVRVHLTSVQRMEITNGRIGERAILDTVLEEDEERIRYTSEHISRESFETAVNAILGARRIYIIGMRCCSALAEFTNFYFSIMFENVKLVRTTSGSEIFEQLMHIGPEDVLIAISFPRYSTRIINASEYAVSMGAKLIAITDIGASPIAEKAYAALTARSDMASFADSLVAPLSVINALIAAIAQRKNTEISETLAKLEQVWDEYNVYSSSDRKKKEKYE